MVCFSRRSDDAFSIGAFGQLWIAVCCVLRTAVSLRARTGVLASSFMLEAGGFDSPLVHPSGPNYPAHCAASTTSLVCAATLVWKRGVATQVTKGVTCVSSDCKSTHW